MHHFGDLPDILSNLCGQLSDDGGRMVIEKPADRFGVLPALDTKASLFFLCLRSIDDV